MGCGYSGYEFGARYPDSICIDGHLWDLDSDDGEGGLTQGGETPCPACNTAAWLKRAGEEILDLWDPWSDQIREWEKVLARALTFDAPAATAQARELAGLTFVELDGDIGTVESRTWPWIIPELSHHLNLSLQIPSPG